MLLKLSKLCICSIVGCFLLAMSVLVVAAKPTQQTSYLYNFVGKVIDSQYNRALPELDIQVSCDGLVTTTVQSDLAGNWSGTLNLPTAVATCDIQLLLLPGYQGIGVEVQGAHLIISPTHIRYSNIPYDVVNSATFHIQKPMATTQTSHFSIEWYTYEEDPDYPKFISDTNTIIEGTAYINVISNALEDAWSYYSNVLGYKMPPPTPGRSDGLITVHVQAIPFKVSEGYEMYPTGLAYGGQIWLRNERNASNGQLRDLAMHELFHLVQYNYLGYNLDADLNGWVVNAPKLMLRDLWLIESTAS